MCCIVMKWEDLYGDLLGDLVDADLSPLRSHLEIVGRGLYNITPIEGLYNITHIWGLYYITPI